jgi:sporulation protein YlmC with PRC-barrel domain
VLRSVKELEKFRLTADDGQLLGRIKDVYFDDQSWSVKHLVVALDPRVHGQKQVLLDPRALGIFREDEETILADVSARDLEQSPSANSVLPVCKQYASLALASPGASFLARGLTSSDPHLRSARAVTHYRLMVQGEFAGTLSDFLVDTEELGIRYLAVEQVIDRRRIQFHVLPASVERFTWATQRIHLRYLQPVVLEGGIAGDPEMLFSAA